MSNDKDDKSTASIETKSAIRDLAKGLTGTEGTDNPTLNGDERNVGKDPLEEDLHPHSARHERSSFSFEDDRSPWIVLGQQLSK